MGEWKPIETAPKDGSQILVFEKEIEIGSYVPADPTEPDSNETWADSGASPTHWMSLPAPPKE